MPDDRKCDFCDKMTKWVDMDYFTDDEGVRKAICVKCDEACKGGPPMQTHSFDDDNPENGL